MSPSAVRIRTATVRTMVAVGLAAVSLLAVAAPAAAGAAATSNGRPAPVPPPNPNYFPPHPGPMSGPLGGQVCFPLPGLYVAPGFILEVTTPFDPSLTPTHTTPAADGNPNGEICVGVQESGVTGLVRFRVLFSDGSVTLGWYTLAAYFGVPAPDEYLPPDPAPVAVEPGEMGCFPMPNLYMAQPAEIKIESDLQPPYDPVAEPPNLFGDPNAKFCVGVKGDDFRGVATFYYSLKGVRTTEYHTWTLKLYVGVPLPDTGSTATGPAVLGAALLGAGAVLTGVARRRRFA